MPKKRWLKNVYLNRVRRTKRMLKSAWKRALNKQYLEEIEETNK